jgi:hypothetical protein
VVGGIVAAKFSAFNKGPLIHGGFFANIRKWPMVLSLRRREGNRGKGRT